MAKKKPFYTNINPSKQIAAAVILFTFATLLSRDIVIASWEAAVFGAIYDLPRALYPFFFAVTQLGSIYMLGALGLFYLIKRNYHIVLRLLLTGTFAFLLAGFAKSIWGRARPEELLSDVVTLDISQGPGFPSGHVALAVALAFTIGHYLPRKYHWIPVVWIVGVALSRVYLGVHLPLDLVGGFALGWLSYALFRHVRIYDVAQRKRAPK